MDSPQATLALTAHADPPCRRLPDSLNHRAYEFTDLRDG